MDISFVMPAYNEADNIEPLYRRIKKTVQECGLPSHEIIFVENGSSDASIDLLRRLNAEDSAVHYVKLSRNFGYQGAIAAGLKFAEGDLVMVLDGDQQDPPEHLSAFLTKLREGYDVVYGVRQSRREGWFKRLMYHWFYKIWTSTSNIHIPRDAGEYCLMRRCVIEDLNRLPETLRFHRGLRSWVGHRQTGLGYNRDERGGGVTKFSFAQMFGFAADALFSFSSAPINFMLLSGFAITTFAGLILLFNISVWILHALGVKVAVGLLPKGITQLMTLLTLFFGIIVIYLGIIGSYVIRIFNEVKQRPPFLIEHTSKAMNIP